MKLTDQLHCPHCKGRLTASSSTALRCTACDRVVPLADGIADFVVGSLPAGAGSDRYRGGLTGPDSGKADLLTRIQTVVGNRWPTSLGDTIEFGCGGGETTYAIVAGQTFRSLVVLDSDMETLRVCRSRITKLEFDVERPISYAALSGGQDAVRDAVADTVIGTGLLSGIGDVRALLAMVHRVLKPNGRAMFVVPNRRYYEAMCLAMAEALVQRYARDGVWPEGQQVALELLAQTRRLIVHRGDTGFLSGLDVKHLFDSEKLEDEGLEVGFSTAEMIPLDPDPNGSRTTHRVCHNAGAPEGFSETFGALAAAVGQPFFNLLGRQDASASSLLWLTKARGPNVRLFVHQTPLAPVDTAGPDAALGGISPRWSVELLAQETPDGITVSLGGWCLCNTDVHWVRLTLVGVTRYAPVWRPRPDVHEVLNRSGVYHPLNTLCSGMASELLFDGVHAINGECPFHLDIILASGLIVTGPAPETLVMDEPMVIAH